MANRTLEFVLQTKKQGDALAEITAESKQLADTLRNKVTLAMSEADVASRKLAAAQEKLAASSDPEEQAKLTHEINKARVAMDSAQAKADKYEDEIRSIGTASQQAGDAQAGMSLSLTDLKSGLDLASQGVEVLGKVFDATVGKAAAWGDDMGDLAQITGQSVESTSQMAASLELLGVSSDKFTGIIKAMTKQGLQLNMDTLVALSREYQAIQDPVEQNEFLFKNFGRAAEDMAEVMGKSQEELLLLGEAARTSGKVIGEEAAAQAEQLNMQMAILQQKAEGAAIALGNVLVPAVLDFIDTNDKAKGSMLAAYGIQQQNTTATETQTYALSEYTAGLKDADLSIRRVTDATSGSNDALSDSKAVYGDALSALREFNIGEAQRMALEQAIKLASGELTQEDIDRKEAIGFLTKQLELGNITQAEYIEKLNELATGAATARDAINSIPANRDINLNYRFNTSGQPPNPAAGDYNLPGGDSGVYNPTPGQEITPVEGAYADGGSFVVPGSGTGDRPYLVNMTPGEHVNITPQGQAPRGGGVTVNVMPGAIVLNGGGDTRGVADALLQQLGAAVRQAMQGGAAYVGAR